MISNRKIRIFLASANEPQVRWHYLKKNLFKSILSYAKTCFPMLSLVVLMQSKIGKKDINNINNDWGEKGEKTFFDLD